MDGMDEWKAESDAWRQKLQEHVAQALNADGEVHVTVYYGDVARAFPRVSTRYIDRPAAELNVMRDWAASLGWKVVLEPDNGTPHEPPIRFSRE